MQRFRMAEADHSGNRYRDGKNLREEETSFPK
jgi:hypothetical protein